MLFYIVDFPESQLPTIPTSYLETYVHIDVLDHTRFAIDIIFTSHLRYKIIRHPNQSTHRVHHNI